MATSFGEWMLRMVMLVLAGLVTLSILGSIAAMSNDAGVVGDDFRRASGPIAAPDAAAPVPTEAAPQSGSGQRNGAPSAPAVAVRAEAAAAPEWTNRWLEAIAYALLALAGLLALAILLLSRGLRQLRRIADAAEARRN